MEYSYMTQEGYDKLVAELKELETVQRPEISKMIAEARDKGDLSENAEYDAAKEAQGMLEARIARIQNQILSSRIIDKSQIQTETVQILSKVSIRNLDTKAEFTYTLVSDSETDLSQNKISVNTPIASALMGKKVGDQVEVVTPRGLMHFELLEIGV